MLSFRDFWSRHKRKIYITLGVIGSGYALYKLYDAHRSRLRELEEKLAGDWNNDERTKAQLQEHFENIQTIGETLTLPHSIDYLRSRVAEELDLSVITERLMQAKGQPSSLTSSEKLQLWERLKILSFTKMVLSLWSMTMLSLYVKVLVNILGRYLYIDTARGLQSSQLLEEVNLTEYEDEQKFLASADFLATNALLELIHDMQAAATESLKNKHLKDVFNTSILHSTILQIFAVFMSTGKPHVWVEYLMPGDPRLHKPSASTDGEIPLKDSKLDKLMVEARVVLSSDEFRNMVEVSLKAVVEELVKEMNEQCKSALSTGVPLAKLVPRLAQTSSLLLDKPMSGKFIEIIRSIPEVELFFTLLYSSSLPLVILVDS